MSVAGGGTSVALPQRPTILSWRRLLTCLGVGLLAAVLAVAGGVPEISVLVGWSAAAAALLVWVWRTSWPRDATATKQLAEEEGRTRVTDSAVLCASVLSLGAVAEALVRSGSLDGTGVAAVILGVVVVVLSWALVNSVFALKYARRYYADGPDGGIDFGQREPPAYSDFAYLAFTVGMAFAVPDTQLEAARVRKVALGHALLTYLFNTIVIAVAINLVTNLGQQG